MNKLIFSVIVGLIVLQSNPLFARYYDATSGRFLQEDPLMSAAPMFLEGSKNMFFDSQSLNLYSYVGNMPTFYTDPLGLYWYDDLGDFSAGFGDTVSLGMTKELRSVLNEYTDLHDSMNPCSNYYTAGKWSGYAWWLSFNGIGYLQGAELKAFGMRFAPWGNRTNNPSGRWPHYHRRGPLGQDGRPSPGSGIGRHRPWEGW